MQQMTRIVAAPFLPPDAPAVRVVAGFDPAIDRAAQAERADRRFLSASWFAATGGASPATLIVEAAGHTLLALLTVRARRGLRAVPGAYWPFRSAPVAADADVALIAAALDDRVAARALGPVWRLGPVYADDPVLAAARASRTWQVLERRIATGFVLDFARAGADGPWPRPSTLKKNRFHEKHLAAAGALDWRFARGADWTPALFDTLAAIEAKSWHAGSTDAKFLGAGHRAVWEALARDPAQAERMHAAILSVGGEPVAFAFDLDAGETRYAIANSYDPALAKHSPGKCLSYRMMAHAAAHGIARIDWGAGDSGYKGAIGAAAGPEIVDCLMLRGRIGRLAAAMLGPPWARTGRPAAA